MQFLTARDALTGVHRTVRSLGDRDYNASFRFRVVADPAVEGVVVDARAARDAGNYWAVELFLPDIARGVREGWELSLKRKLRFCGVRVTVRDQSFHNLDTHSASMRAEGSLFVTFTLGRYTAALPPLRAEWLTSDVVAIARGIHAKQALDGLPALTDALLEAGCDDPLALEHLTTCPDHGPMCWVVEMICAQAAARDGTAG